MKTDMKSGLFVSNLGMEWAVLTAAPLPLVLHNLTPALPIPYYLRILIISAAILCCVLFAYYVLRRPAFGKSLGFIALCLVYLSVLPLADASPFYTLLANVFFIGIFFMILGIRPAGGNGIRNSRVNRAHVRASWSVHTQTIILLTVLLAHQPDDMFFYCVIYTSFMVTALSFVYWAYRAGIRRNTALGTCLAVAGGLALFSGLAYGFFVLLVLNVTMFAFLFIDRQYTENENYWWDVMLAHPARVLFISFFLLCLLGTVLLLIPEATKGSVSFIDAAFTSVSAVCVTGLIVLDTPKDFTLFGQGVILMLIQLGGLGIMSITAIAIQSFGKRLSLRHERVLTSMTDTDNRTLVSSIYLIFKYTFILELLGCISLTAVFIYGGEQAGSAFWRGLFTAVSAFCNAGFALQSDSLAGYSSNAMVLNIVSALIILGGMAPAAALAIPAWVKRGKVPLGARLAIAASVLMVFFGGLLMLVFEWNGILSGMTLWDKLWNAFFQSVTLRTAGFNSVDLTAVSSPSLVMMHIFMFIGGSPGGTAGGIKTTTIAVLVLTFWANITNRKRVVVKGVMISNETVSRAVTIVISGFIVWFASVVMIEVTQQLPSRELLFEVTSAIGTVGLSLGATPMLDEIGKLIIIVTMFAGRIGPMSLFTFLGQSSTTSGTEYLEKDINLT